MSFEDRYPQRGTYGHAFSDPEPMLAEEDGEEEELEEDEDEGEEEEEFDAQDELSSEDFDDDGSLNPVEDNPGKRDSRGRFVKKKKSAKKKKTKGKGKRRAKKRSARLLGPGGGSSRGTMVRVSSAPTLVVSGRSSGLATRGRRKKARKKAGKKSKAGKARRRSVRTQGRSVESRVGRLERAVSYLSHNDRVTQKVMRGLAGAAPANSSWGKGFKSLVSNYRTVPGYRSLLDRRG